MNRIGVRIAATGITFEISPVKIKTLRKGPTLRLPGFPGVIGSECCIKGALDGVGIVHYGEKIILPS